MTSSPLVSVEWLSQNLTEPNLVLLDCTIEVYDRDDGKKDSRAAQQNYIERHIPNARFVDLLSDFSVQRENARFGIPDASDFARKAEALGISNSDLVVIYSASSVFWATRLWWLFRYFGHHNVAVLDGGLESWISAGLPTTAVLPNWTPGRFEAEIDTSRLAQKVDVLDIVTNPPHQTALLDVLSPDYFRGRLGNIYGYKRLGHIPTAKNFPTDLVLEPGGKFRSISEIQSIASQEVGPPNRSVVTYCGGGIAATQVAFALELAGYTNVRVYSGSLQEWSADPNLPMSVSDE